MGTILALFQSQFAQKQTNCHLSVRPTLKSGHGNSKVEGAGGVWWKKERWSGTRTEAGQRVVAAEPDDPIRPRQERRPQATALPPLYTL